ncbi:SDR family oxidoreductase [Nostocaceae cyanobacterium CENA369]|jgi:short-subunit dehydrogenase|uniref:SDR family oxidoreductase n=1 Tax=Dendronalium phyllosphericum CENA369 TaxID=1725256 RepID=A0A8J7I2Q0_9NOST|nr:SDR family oxidoreductase [Dendronalium phyllosphericum]MBH8573595.1 SDR family oxidoreductase [Dendronalium phyllosphericum CENA369]
MKTTNHLNREKTALITGASGGIGYELAKLFARDGYNLVLVARGEEKLTQIAKELTENSGIKVEIIIKDLSLSTAPEEIFTKLQQAAIKIDVLVNNAGFGTYGFFHETDLKTELEMLQVNVVSLTHLTKLFLKDMVEQGYGKILNLSSGAAFQPGPLLAVYFATKAYVLSFSEAIANELEGTGVSVTVVCPGPTESGFQQRAAMEESKMISGQKMMDAETVAKISYQGLMANKTVVIPGVKNKLLAEAVRFTPRKMVVKIARSINNKQ